MELDEARAFLALAAAGSLTAASAQTGVPRSTLRRRLDALEESLNCPLFVSDGRRMTLTARGQTFQELARQLIAHADQIESTMRGTDQTVERTLVVIVHSGFHPALVFGVGSLLRRRHPQVRFDLRVRDNVLAALVDEGDVAVTLDVGLPDDGVWIARRIRSVPLRLRASQAYLTQHGRPQSIADLARHDVVTCSMVGPRDSLPLLAGGTIRVKPLASADDLRFCAQAAASGHGIALSPPPVLHSGAEGTLEPVLEDVVGVDMVARIVAPGGLSTRPQVASLVRGLLDYASGFPWE